MGSHRVHDAGRRPPTPRRVWVTPLLLCMCACVPTSIFDALGASESESESESAGFVPERPAFVDPSDGSERLSSDRLIDLDLRVRGVRQGSTTVLLDGVSLGTLPPGGSGANAKVGELSNERLTLHFDGALTVGVHALELFNGGDSQGLVSSPIAIEVEGSPMPSFQAQLDSAVLAPALDLWVVGQGELAHAAWTEQGPGPRLAIAPLQADGSWDIAAARRFALPGYVNVARPSAGVAVRVEAAAVHLAWLVGESGARLDYANYGEGSSPSESGTAFHLSDPAFASREWVGFSAPRFVGRALALAVHVPADTEQTSPGDYAVWTADWAATSSQPGAFARTSSPGREDMSSLGTLLDLQRVDGRDAALSLVARAWIRSVQQVPDTPGIRLPDASDQHSVPVGQARGPFAGVAGALGSRTVLTLDQIGGLRMIHEAVLAERASTFADDDALPAMPSSGPICPGLMGGHPVFLVPYGSAAEAQLVSSDGNRVAVQSLGINCERVALSPTGAGQTVGSDDELALPFLCAHGGQLRAGRVIAQSP